MTPRLSSILFGSFLLSASAFKFGQPKSFKPSSFLKSTIGEDLPSVLEDKSLPAPRKIVTYPLPGDPAGGTLFFYGKPDASSIVVFSAGYPDDHENGQVFCSRLAEENDTLVGLMCLPGFDDRPDKPWSNHKPEGYTFNEMINAIRDAVKEIRLESTNEKAKLTGIFHDWGVCPGVMWANQSLEDETADSPDELILLDVLPPVHKSQRYNVPYHERRKLREELITLYYQGGLALSFTVQRFASNDLALVGLTLGLLSTKILPISPLLPIDDEVVACATKDLSRVTYKAYPYFNLFESILTGRVADIIDFFTLPKDLKKTPILYIYGTEKRVNFHDYGAVAYLQREARKKKE